MLEAERVTYQVTYELPDNLSDIPIVDGSLNFAFQEVANFGCLKRRPGSLGKGKRNPHKDKATGTDDEGSL
jgi:hypothetical protein